MLPNDRQFFLIHLVRLPSQIFGNYTYSEYSNSKTLKITVPQIKKSIRLKRIQSYKNILNYANGNAKNVRNICKKVRNLTESMGRANKYARHRRDYRRHLQSRCPDIIRT